MANQTINADIVIVGGGCSGTAASIQAARLGAKVVLVEATPWLGGMATSAGVSCMDGNNGAQRTGFFNEFRALLENYYGGAANLQINWVSNCSFEPHVGNQIFQQMAAAEPNLTIYFESELKEVLKSGNRINGVIIKDKNGDTITINAHITIEATELGEVMEMAGIPFAFGRESKAQTGEAPAPAVADDIIQDPTYTIIIKRYVGEDRTWKEPPEGYDPSLFNCCCQGACSGAPATWTCDMMLAYGKLQNNKYMINWPLKGNDYYVPLYSLSKEERLKKYEEAKKHSLSFIYFHQTVIGWQELDLATDEYPTTDSLPFFPYIRESRRMTGISQFRLQDITNRYDTLSGDVFKTTVAVGDYFIDHHHAAYNKPASFTGESYPQIPKIGVPLFSFIPKDTDGFIAAEKCISVSHIVNGCTRLQPVVMLIGQAAGTAAAIACKKGIEPRALSVRDVQTALLNSGATCFPMQDVYPNLWAFKSIQRVALTGALKVTDNARNTFFYPDNTTPLREIVEPLKICFNKAEITSTTLNLDSDNAITRGQIAELIYETGEFPPPASSAPYFQDVPQTHPYFNAIQFFYEKGCGDGWVSTPDFQPDKAVTRAELAVALDKGADAYNKYPVPLVPQPVVTPAPPPMRKAECLWKIHHTNTAEKWTGLPETWFPSNAESNRDIAYNPATGHILVPDNANRKIHILNSSNGIKISELSTTPVIAATLVFASLGTDSEGKIYACNYDQNNFRLYRWESESSPCEIAASGTLAAIAGRAMDIIGTGKDTKIFLTRSTESGGFYIFTTTDGKKFTLGTTVQSSGFNTYGGYGIAAVNEESVLVKPIGDKLKNYLFNKDSLQWAENAQFDSGDYFYSGTSKLKFSADRKYLYALANSAFGPYTIDGATILNTGFMIYEFDGYSIKYLRSVGILEETNDVFNNTGGIAIDEKKGISYVLFPKNGFAAYNIKDALHLPLFWASF